MEYKSFGEYLKSLPPDTIFRIWERKNIFTPYEWNEKFSDQSLYKNDECTFKVIKDIIELPDGDLLLATHNWSDKEANMIYYFKLSEIELMKINSDMEE